MSTVYVSQTGANKVGERYVGTTNTAIQQAVDYLSANGGGMLIIEKGEYDIKSSIVISSPNITVQGEMSGTKLIPSFTGSTGVIVVNGTDVTRIKNVSIEDLSIGHGTTQSGYDGIQLLYAEECKVYNCILQNHANVGLTLQNSLNNKISGNTVRYNAKFAITVTNTSYYNSIVENIVQKNTKYGIYVAVSSTDNAVTGNIINHNGGNGIQIQSTSNCNIISNNIIHSNYGVGIYVYSAYNNTITSNSVFNNYTNGIQLFGDNNTVESNNAYINGNSGIQLSSARLNSVVGNIVSNNNGSGGIYLSASTYNTITGNRSVGDPARDIALNSTSTSNTIDGNITNYIVIDASSSNTVGDNITG